MIILWVPDICHLSSPFPPWHRRGCTFVRRLAQQDCHSGGAGAASLVCLQPSDLNSTYTSCHHRSCCAGLGDGRAEMAQGTDAGAGGAGEGGLWQHASQWKGARGKTGKERADGVTPAGGLLVLWGGGEHQVRRKWHCWHLPWGSVGGRDSFCRFDHSVRLGFP